MTEEQRAEGFGEYFPEAASHPAYSDAMAAWRNQVASLQQSGELPVPAQEPQQATETSAEPEGTPESQEPSPDAEERQDDDGDGRTDQSEPTEHELYDPSRHNAPEVMLYLDGAGYQEALRVLEAEQQGKARKGILNHKDEILQREKFADERLAASHSASDE